MAALRLAANDGASAPVQWLQLPVPERRAGDRLDAALAAQLGKLADSNNENYRIAATLAARLGPQRVFAIDDHTGDSGDVPDETAYGKAVQNALDAASAPAKPMRDREDALTKRGDMLALYRYIVKRAPLSFRAQRGTCFTELEPGQVHMRNDSADPLAGRRPSFSGNPAAQRRCCGSRRVLRREA